MASRSSGPASGPAPEQAPPPPADQALRARFVTGLDSNYSVLAPAGVGKTKAIVDRVVAIATGDPERAKNWLPRLVVVTYTNKAADEMYQRARNAIIERRVGLPLLTAFNRAFFGTIHSFCVRLLRRHGHLCGLPTQFEPVENDEDIWNEFVRQSDQLAPRLPAAYVTAVTQLMPMDHLLKLAHKLGAAAVAAQRPEDLAVPEVDLSGLLAQTGTGRSAQTIARSQEAAKEWLEAWTRGVGFAPLPKPQSTARDFKASWERTFTPLREWLGRAALHVAREISLSYRDYRRARGALTYDDQVELAWELVRDPASAKRLRAEGYRIILDEAQDTDPLQFNILLELARPPAAQGQWLDAGGAPPEPGRFCMVGDPQQAIYSQRADLGWYEKVRASLVRGGQAHEVVFSVTFRCDQAIVDAVNALVQPMFERTDGQVGYHPLQSRPAVGPGQVLCWSPHPPADADGGVKAAALEEGRQLARRLREMGHESLGARSWSEVAILCPRIRWLQSLAVGLREQGLGPQVHSERAVQADDPAYAWFTALLTVMARPSDGFEVVGVLREIYGIADEDLARHANARQRPWSLLTDDPAPDSPIAHTLAALRALRTETAPLPLRDAARRIVEATALCERLEALELPELDARDTIEALLARAADAESRGLSMAEFAENLRDGMETGVPARPVVKDAVQLLTCHKAKGLQWDVVLVPMLFRTIGEPNEYPVLLRSPAGHPPQVALSAHDLHPMQELVEQRRRQELQRLLYVALTRARRTLVLVDDDAFFPRKKPNRSFADLLGLMDDDGRRVFNETWNALPDRPAALPRPPSSAIPPALPLRAPLGRADLDAASARAREAPRRVLPYQLGEAEARSELAFAAPEAGRSAGAEAARAYGIWWHEAVERMPWSQGTAAHRDFWRTALITCPNVARGTAEGELLFASPLARRLATAGWVIRREIPVLWSRSDRECVEGIVDLAAWDPAAAAWLVVDWKTNVVGSDGTEHLRRIYEPQLCAYAEALRALSGRPVEAGIHATATGVWIPCVKLA